jgi:hypothetical protein
MRGGFCGGFCVQFPGTMVPQQPSPTSPNNILVKSNHLS